MANSLNLWRILFPGGVELSQCYSDLKLRPPAFTATVRGEGRDTPNAGAPLPPQHPTRVTTSLERDVESCWTSVSYMFEGRRNDAEKRDSSPACSWISLKWLYGKGHTGRMNSPGKAQATLCFAQAWPRTGTTLASLTFHVFTKTPESKGSIKSKRWALPWLQGAEPHHGTAAAALHAAPKDQVTWALQLVNRIN